MEEGKELVMLLLRDRIELVIVALGATNRQSQPNGCSCIDAVEDISGLVFLRNGATLEVDRVVAMEPAGEALLHAGVRQQVARELFDGEAVKREVAVGGVDNP